MKSQAVFFVEPGKTEIREWDCPDPGAGEIQVRCIANGICMGETTLFTGKQHSHYPRPVGHEGIGVVTKVPQGVGHIREGDFVDCFGWSEYQNLSAYRVNKFVAPPRDPATHIAEPVACVVTALRSYNITPGDRVLLMGAGFMGLLNVQGLAHCPLDELVVVDIKKDNLDLAREFGATETIQAGSPEGEARLEELKHRGFDLVIEAAAVPATIQSAGEFCRTGGRLSIFAWHHEPRAVDMGLWHIRGLTVLNSAPGIGTDHNSNSMERAVRLLERGVFDLSRLVTHRHSYRDVQAAMELSVTRPPGYIKGVLTFDN